MLPVLEHVLCLAADESTSQRANDAMVRLFAKEVSSQTTCYSSHEATLSLLWIVWICRITIIAVWICWIA